MAKSGELVAEQVHGIVDKYCPPRDWAREHICDVSILTYTYNMRMDNQLVEVTLRYRVERCTEDYVLSDLIHSVTLFPGEEVFLSTRTRHSIARLTEDKSYSASQISRSSDRVWMETFKTVATDFDETTGAVASSSSHSEFSQTQGGGSGGVNILGIVKIGGGGSHISGDFDASSSQSLFTSLNQHMESTLYQSNQVARDTMAMSVTQVNSHREVTQEFEEELAVSTRRFRNINQCHTVTHYFYQVAKRQRVKITLESRTLRPINRFANTAVRMKPLEMSVAGNARVEAAVAAPGQVEAVPAFAAVPFGFSQRMSLDQINYQRIAGLPAANLAADEKARLAAVEKVQQLLAPQPVEFELERVDIIPTDALYVESELGNCILCEPYVVAKHELELERLRLENKLLERQAELLEQHKDYRCCDEEPDEDE